MSILAALPIVSELIALIPNENKRAELTARLQELEMEAAKGQLAVNEREATNANWFVAGWRPAVGWLCVVGLGFNTLVAPNLGLVPVNLEILATLLFGMLGLGGLRTFEKTRGVAR